LHCRSGFEASNEPELPLARSLEIAGQIAALGTKLVILTGGEPILYDGWEQVAGQLTSAGVRVRLFVSGFGFDEKNLVKAREAGVSDYAVSLDGPATIHDGLRPPAARKAPSPFDEAKRSIRMLLDAKQDLRVVTQVNRMNVDLLPEIYEMLVDWGVKRWQVALCQPTGRADYLRSELICPPADLERIVRALLTAAKENKLIAPQHCTIGYMTAEEPVLRSRETKGRPIWTGCRAGIRTFAITPSGGVKGCTTLPDEFVTGNLNEQTLAEIWADDDCFPYTRNWSESMLAGKCSACAFGKTCRAGCPALAYATTGAIGATPYCLKLVRKD
jgi:AdoMet-dependent heme synthase